MFLYMLCAILLVNALAAEVQPAPADIECKDTAHTKGLCQAIYTTGMLDIPLCCDDNHRYLPKILKAIDLQSISQDHAHAHSV
ncbi:hypothetical protein GCK32_001632 [Trichostrongylus colubriformis]|uniref:Uncharacterized protein n=1 Tax=Trichostrongylus colubriformis TaxID=6319 RepID=A0AAN8IG70_TRICO